MALQTQRKLGPTQRRLLWAIAQSGPETAWTLTRHGISRDRSTVAVVLDSLARRGLVRPAGATDSASEDAWRVTADGARVLLDLWPRQTQAGFHAALRERLIACVEQAAEPADPETRETAPVGPVSNGPVPTGTVPTGPVPTGPAPTGTAPTGTGPAGTGGRTYPDARLVTQARGL